MNPKLKLVLSAALVLAVAAFVARGCTHKKAAPPKPKSVKTVRTAPLPRPEAAVPAPAAGETRPAAAGRMAIILDDWGNDFLLMKDAVEIGRPLTLSILPHLKYSLQLSKEASAKGLGVMLHMPMQPVGQRRLEPRTILTTTSDEEIVAYLDSALKSVPQAEGVNNHMGSAATSDLRVMTSVLSHLKKKNLFFVDSATISTTVAPKVAVETGIAFAKRDVFIDNEPDLEKIKAELRRAVRIALSHGTVVVIGHDKKLTLRAIREMVPEIEEAGVRLVKARELIRK
ncbi:MAG TPA: divergent polysaccharide deacetylase family protein [Candidatus Eisenbacteria bacterium]|nr:divergent polysaccharide deacetylase family protein [Candidatus Eisenbacteria bacterium]